MFSGYDQVPVESMQGLDIGCHQGVGGGSTYGNMTNMDFEQADELPQPPQDNNTLAAWYDTDL